MNGKDDTSKPAVKIPDALVVVAITASSYAFAFLYEKSYADYFGIPIRIIAVEPSQVVIPAITLIMAVLSIFPFINLIPTLLPKNLHPAVARRAAIAAAILVACVIQIYLFGFSEWKYWFMYIVMLVIASVIMFALPLITFRRSRKYAAKLESQDNHEAKMGSLLHSIGFRLGPKWLPALSAFLIGCWFSITAGYAQAYKQTEFLITGTSPEMVVLQMYNDTLVCAPFDQTTREVKNGFVLLKKAEDPSLVLRREIVGPLRPAKLQSMMTITPTAAITPTTMPGLTPTPVP